jgi:hypothetical protein
MQRFFFIILIFDFGVCFSQTTDSIIEPDYYATKWMTIGVNTDLINSVYGILISNGYDERPLIHFEDFSEHLIYKFTGQTDFKKDYSFGANLSWKYPCKYLVLTTIEYIQSNYEIKDLFHRDINLSAMTWIKFLQSGLTLKIGHQTVNSNRNFGVNLGLQKVLIYKLIYSGFSVGYYGDYFAYSIYAQGFVYKHNLGLRVGYDRIDKYDFLNLGLNFTLIR